MSATAARARFTPPNPKPNPTPAIRSPTVDPAETASHAPTPETPTRTYESSSPGRRPARSISRPTASAPIAAAAK